MRGSINLLERKYYVTYLRGSINFNLLERKYEFQILELAVHHAGRCAVVPDSEMVTPHFAITEDKKGTCVNTMYDDL